jgi:hypothetical protein
MYANIAAMLVEPSGLISILSIGLLVSAAHNGLLSYASDVFGPRSMYIGSRLLPRTHFGE